MPAYEFGSRQAANEFRDNAPEKYLKPEDSRVEKTVRLSGNVPDSIERRAESAALGSQTSEREGAGRANLTESEKDTLRRTTSFTWQQNGFEAMAVKAAVQSKGVTEWQDYYEPGEGVDSALQKVRDAKGGAVQSRASTAIGGRRVDAQEQDNTARRSRQAERAQAEQVGRAKAPAVVEQDDDAIGFIREEQQFGGDVFDIAFSETDQYGRPVGTGSDMGLLEQRNQQRSQRARTVDEQKSANVTRDPIAWSQSPNTLDFPGIDTIDPQKTHNARSERAQEQDESELAPRADTPAEWATQPDEYDWPGVDTPPAMGLGPNQEAPGPVPEPTEDRPSAALGALGPEGQDDPTDTAGFLLSQRDVSAAPEELTDGVGLGSPSAPGGQAYDATLGRSVEIDRPDQEQEPPQEAINEQSGGSNGFTDDRGRDGSLASFGMDTDGSVFRESRQEVESATEFGVDDRSREAVESDGGDDSEQQGFEVFGGGVRENETLF